MGPVSAINRQFDLRSGQHPSAAVALAATERAATGRALVPIAPAESPSERHTVLARPSATFLAQLIAARSNLPQARERRRAEPRDAIAAYAAAARPA